ncbi:helix-turn-helix domain-containing protein [Micromonospora sp. CA-248212]|uniref:helix-turn-helix domain-containing protein n=1 Tax=Micromonospora sp. CA-248212 TaxID=3239961 RepID=UPI003D9221F2
MTEYTDPTDMPEDERMTDAEFRVVREHLGLTGDWLAGHLGVSARTVRHWEQGKYPIPDGVRLAMEGLEAETAQFVTAIVGTLLASNETDLVVLTYRSDADYRAAHPDLDWPASWHRAVVARVAQEVPALSIAYAPAAAMSASREARA